MNIEIKKKIRTIIEFFNKKFDSYTEEILYLHKKIREMNNKINILEEKYERRIKKED